MCFLCFREQNHVLNSLKNVFIIIMFIIKIEYILLDYFSMVAYIFTLSQLQGNNPE